MMGLNLFGWSWEPHKAFKQLEEHETEVIAALEEIKSLSVSFLNDYNDGRYERAETELKELIALDTEVVHMVEDDPIAYLGAIAMLKSCKDGLSKFGSQKDAALSHRMDMNSLVNALETAIIHLEARETALKIEDENVLADFMNVVNMGHPCRGDIEKFITRNSNFLKAGPNKKIAKKIISRLKDICVRIECYEDMIEDEVERLTGGSPKVKRGEDEKSQVERLVDIIQDKFPERDRQDIRDDVSRGFVGIHKNKRSKSRRGR